MKQNWLDKAVSWVAPKAGAARLQARARISTLSRTSMIYDAATPSHRNAARRYLAGDANTAARSGRQRLAYTSRDLERNSPLANRILSVLATEVIGAGIIPNVTGVEGDQEKRAETLLKQHCDTAAIDVAGRQDLYGLQVVAFRAAVRDGESLMVRRRPKASERLPLPFQIAVLEADFLDPQIDGELKGGHFAVEGVEFNKVGKVVAYHLFDKHPGNNTDFRYPESKRYDAADVVHLFRIDRPGQSRGVSWLAPVIVTLGDLEQYTDAQLVKQKVAALFVAFRTKSPVSGEPENVGEDNEISGAGNSLETLEPGVIDDLESGQEVSFSSPPSVGEFEQVIRVGLRQIALGMGISNEALTGDLSQVNFTSGRMGHLFFQRNIDGWRAQMVLPQMCGKIGQWLVDGLRLMMRLDPEAGIGWVPPKREMIDPVKELKAAAFAAEHNLGTNSQFLRSLGFDPQDVEGERAAELKRYGEKGIEPVGKSTTEQPKKDKNDG